MVEVKGEASRGVAWRQKGLRGGWSNPQSEAKYPNVNQTNSLAVRHLFSISLDTGNPIDLQGGPQGRRMIVGVTGGTFEGERLRGSVLEPSGDWITVRPNGSMKLDVRVVLSP